MDFKPQDLLFFIVLVTLFVKRDPKLFVWTGLISIFLSIPLFSQWIFFTAQRLTWYAFVFFLVAVVLNSAKVRKNENRN